jgi:aryl-alcohol dehydrogenase-like predicted oxidoreductase
MQYRKLGTTGREVSVVGIGCWAMGGPLTSMAPVDDNESIAAIRHGLDVGINLIDTAPSFGYGHSEEIVGRAVASCREQVMIVTKCGWVWRQPGGRLERCLKKESVRRECEASLRRLRVEHIDVYLVQAPDPTTPIAETMEALGELRAEGKIGAVGLSNFNCQEISAARKCGSVDCLQPELSLLEPDAIDEILPYSREYNIGVITYASLARGLLAGRFDASSRPTDVRASDPRFTGDAWRRNLAFVERLRPIAARHGRSVAEVALRWVIQQEGVTCALFGARRASQVAEVAGAATFALTQDDLRDIELLLQERERE